MQFYGISFMHPYKQSGRCQDVLDIQTCTRLPEDEHLVVGNMWKTIELNQIINEINRFQRICGTIRK